MKKELTRFWLNRVGVLLLVSCWASAGMAETLYVGDTLHVGVRAKPDPSLPSLTVIVTGDAVELLEKRQDYRLIRTASGVEGWVSSKYLSTRKPDKLLVSDLRSQNRRLQEQLDSLRAEEATAGKDKAGNASTVTTLQGKIDKLAQENRDLRGLVAGSVAGDSHSWLYWLSGILAMGPLGFLFGLLWYRYQIMKKLGGLTL